MVTRSISGRTVGIRTIGGRTIGGRTIGGWARMLGGAAIVALLVWRVGTGPFLDGIRTIDIWSLIAAVALGMLTTLCAAWRWSLIAKGLGVGLSLRSAVAAYYRSQFLNTTLPGGVLGDVHRAVRHGKEAGDVGRGVRAVAWERACGQVVQIAIAIVLLLVLPSPVRAYLPVALGALLVGGAVAILVGRRVLTSARAGQSDDAATTSSRVSRWARTLRAARGDLRDGVLARHAWPGIVTASIIVVAGHLTTFLIAARTAGASAPLTRLAPLTLLGLLAMSLPLTIGGWGPREGVAAWAFGAAGLTAAQGVATAVVYGVLVIAATLPGAAVLLGTSIRGASIRRASIRHASPVIPSQRRPTSSVARQEASLRG